mmetsp:Transcript_15005/g.30953  ORF Transcript_15005/g.30953 Transcript_15005/m.30953 type:complete len:183 (-) Transcript_15005:321-869(-)
MFLENSGQEFVFDVLYTVKNKLTKHQSIFHFDPPNEEQLHPRAGKSTSVPVEHPLPFEGTNVVIAILPHQPSFFCRWVRRDPQCIIVIRHTLFQKTKRQHASTSKPLPSFPSELFIDACLLSNCHIHDNPYWRYTFLNPDGTPPWHARPDLTKRAPTRPSVAVNSNAYATTMHTFISQPKTP